MSKVSFRARQIDFNKPLPILKHGSELFLEISESALVNRGVPQIPSGMEKEEENEHHFLEVIQALQLRGDVDVKIPVPDIIDKGLEYQKLYHDSFILPKQLIHIRTIVFSDQEPVEYDMDSEDEEWLRQSDLGISPDKFESMIDRLERGCGQKVMNLEEAKYLLQDHPSLVIAVYDYWLNKRVQSRQPLLYSVRQERRDGSSNTDPYVAFRRRSEKMQTRKNRKNDEQSYEKMLILRDQMDSLGEILARLVRREATKEAMVECDFRCFQLRCKLGDWDGTQLIEAENLVRKFQSNSNQAPGVTMNKENKKRSIRKRKVSKRAHGFSNNTLSSDDASEAELDESEEDGPFAFNRTAGCRYLKPRPFPCECPELSLPQASRSPYSCYTLTTIPSICHDRRHVYTGYIRRRLGRGGRIICDRVPAPPSVAAFLESYDKDLQASDSIQFSNYTRSTSTVCQQGPQTCWRQSQAKNLLISNKLKTALMSSQCHHPRFPWPLCTKSPPSVSFEPLLIDPLRRSPRPRLFPAVNDTTKLTLQQLDRKVIGLISGSNLSNQIIPKTNSVTTLTSAQSPLKSVVSETTQVSHTSPSSCEATQAFLSKTDYSVSSPHRLWRKSVRSGVVLQQSEFARSRSEISLNSSNGLGPHTTDDRLLLTDPSVLPPPKVRCLSRDCGPRDTKVPGPQLQTTNGVSPTQIFQVPT